MAAAAMNCRFWWNLLGMRAATERKLAAYASAEPHATGAAAETEESPPQKKMPRRVGERSPGRDPVGPTEQAVEKPEKCAFSGAVVNLSPAQLAQAALAKLQCPECGAIWTARVRGETVTFPPHPPRTNKQAQAVSCWIRQGTTWTLYKRDG